MSETKELSEPEGVYLRAMYLSYLEAALWSSTGDDERPLDSRYGLDDVAGEPGMSDCEDFMLANAGDLQGIRADQAGHDFWLTRNRHGAGFWDRGLGEKGRRLTEAAHAYGESDAYVGDDGKVYLT